MPEFGTSALLALVRCLSSTCRTVGTGRQAIALTGDRIAETGRVRKKIHPPVLYLGYVPFSAVVFSKRYLLRRLWAALTVLLFTSSPLFATNITGAVTNKTSGKPSPGDEVVLLTLSEGMQEAGSTKTDSHGRFSLHLPKASAQNLVRVTHEGVNYFKVAPVGTTSVQVDVYDSAPQVQGVTGRADVMRMHPVDKQLNISELFVLDNTSDPPRTQMSAHGFQFLVPSGAVIDGALAVGPSGLPLNSAPTLLENNRYAIDFPIRPGQTKFQVNYHLASSQAVSSAYSFEARMLMNMQDFVVMLPKSMAFDGGQGQFVSDGENNGMRIFVAHNVPAEKHLAFSVSGAQIAYGDAASQGSAGAQPSRHTPEKQPGGGLGRPEEAPDALHRYKSWIIAALGIAFASGTIILLSRKPAKETLIGSWFVPSFHRGRPVRTAQQRNPLLEGIKEELFRLETERLQGKISDHEYHQSKAALDLTFKRAVVKQGSNS